MRLFISSILICILFYGCAKTTPAVLTPARQLEGTWTTPNPVTFYYSSEGCGSYVRYSSFKMKVSWQITAIGDSAISISWSLISMSGQTTIGSNCGLPCPPIVFPADFVGIVSSSKFSLDEHQSIGNVLVGVFSYTSNIITGTVTEMDCPAYCSGYSTDANTMILTKN